MLDRGVEDFFFSAGNLERAILFARVIPAIDGFSLCGHKNWSVCGSFTETEKRRQVRRGESVLWSRLIGALQSPESFRSKIPIFVISSSLIPPSLSTVVRCARRV